MVTKTQRISPFPCRKAISSEGAGHIRSPSQHNTVNFFIGLGFHGKNSLIDPPCKLSSKGISKSARKDGEITGLLNCLGSEVLPSQGSLSWRALRLGFCTFASQQNKPRHTRHTLWGILCSKEPGPAAQLATTASHCRNSSIPGAEAADLSPSHTLTSLLVD